MDIEKVKNILDRLKNPDTTLKGEKLHEMKRKVADSLSVDRQKLVMRQPFVGGMLMHFEIIPVNDYRIGTAMTDGSRIFFDMDFYTNLTTEERVFVLAHECWHCVYLHFLRCQGRVREIWNIATDCEINYMLKNQGFTAPESLCFPEKGWEGTNAEEMYEKLLKKMKQSQQSSQSSSGDSTQSGGNPSSVNGGNSNNQGGSKSRGKLSGQFDKHIGDDDEDNGGEGSDGMKLPSNRWGEKGEDPDYHPRVSVDAAERIREAVISEIQKIERQQGNIPGDLESILEKYRKPEIPWREVLCQEITKCYSDRREWLPPNRRYVHQGLYLQSRHGEKVKCTVAIDTSGSTTADLPKFLGEVVGLLNSFGNYEMKLIQCDMEIQSVEDYDDCNPFPLEDVSRIKFGGFGGTSFVPVFDYLRDECEDETNILIYFTDSYGDAPKDPPPYNVLWVLTNDADRNFCDWGKKLVFKEKIGDV